MKFESFKERIAQANELAQAGNLHEAVTVFKSLLEESDDENYLEYLHARLGDIYLTVRDLEKAEIHILEALHRRSSQAHYHYLLGFIFSLESRWDQSIDCFRKALALSPGKSEYTRCLGWALHGRGDTVEGKQFLETAAKENPKNAWTYADLAVIHLHEGDISGGLSLITRALKYKPHEPRFLDVKTSLLSHKSGKNTGRLEKRLKKRTKNILRLLSELRVNLLRSGFTETQVENGVRMFTDYLDRGKPAGSKELCSPAIELILSQLEIREDVSTDLLSSRFSVKPDSLHRLYADICRSLSIVHFDQRYSTQIIDGPSLPPLPLVEP